MTVLSWDGTTREVVIELPGLASPLYGPGDVLYGLDVPGERGMVAVALSGARSGEVLAATPLPEGPGDAWGAAGANSFAHGADGVVDVLESCEVDAVTTHPLGLGDSRIIGGLTQVQPELHPFR